MVVKYNLSLLSSISSGLFERTVYRVVSETRKDKVISTEGNRRYHGRYNISGESGILYLSLTKEIAIKEIERKAPRNMLQKKLVLASIDFRLHKTIDLTKISTLQKLELKKEDLISSDYSIHRQLAL